ncbi:hypothetical protein D9X30_1033 [Cupriavidus sp. U2]|nr:hypothetical protein D9X30_1033 [Cupriavidus sp. U2]
MQGGARNAAPRFPATLPAGFGVKNIRSRDRRLTVQFSHRQPYRHARRARHGRTAGRTL